MTSRGLRRNHYFIVAGRLVPENHIAEVARAYLSLDLTQPLVVLGEANYNSPVARSLMAMAADDDRLVLGGHVADRSRFAALVAGATAYIHAHSVGGMNPSLLEAMGCGARVLALDTPFNREALGPTGDYFSAAESDLPFLIRQTLAEPVRTGIDRREQARRRCRSTFSLHQVADAYESLLTTVANAPRWARSTITTAWDDEDEVAD